MKDVDILFQGSAPARLTTATLKSVTLSNCGIAASSLQNILAGQNIERFRYLSASEMPVPTAAATFSVEHIANHLASSRSSLKALTIFPDNVDPRPKLRAFQNLTYLEVPQPGFLQIEDEEDTEVIAECILSMIPRSLEILHFRFLRYNEELKRILHQIVLLKTRGEYSHLRLLRLDFFRFTPVLRGFVGTCEPLPCPKGPW